jgi:hypothetical protein
VARRFDAPTGGITMRNPDVKHFAMIVLALPLGGMLAAGCAGRRPVTELARADQAIRHAQTTSEAASTAPAELATAQAKLSSARRAMADGAYTQARDLADQARAYAELAEEKAESQSAATAARRTLSEVEVIHGEAASSPDAVVVEQRTVTRTAPSSVVVERPVTTVIERSSPPPVDVVVERPQPATRAIVEPASPVIVVPE